MSARVKIPGSLSLVTGAGSGIGRATAMALAQAGSRVLAVDIDESSAKQVGMQTGGYYRCDMRDPDDVQALADQVHSEHGPLSILVNNAGVGMSGSFTSMSRQDWEWIRAVNLDGVVACCRAFSGPMLERSEGQIVNLSSGLGYTPRATEPAYVTTKAAVLALSQCLRADFGPRGVGVTAICPGIINTPIISATRFLGEQAEKKSLDKTVKLFNRGHSPERVASAIITSIEKDRAVVPVGWESWLGWYMHRFLPVAFQQFLAKQAPF